MATKKPAYTEAQIKEFKANPSTYDVTPNKLSFTLEFKEFFMEQKKVPGMTTRKILEKAGYNPKSFSSKTCKTICNRICKEAKSPEGLHPPKGMSSAEKAAAFAAKDLSKQRVNTSIKELQEKIVHLEAEVEFLKKTAALQRKAYLSTRVKLSDSSRASPKKTKSSQSTNSAVSPGSPDPATTDGSGLKRAESAEKKPT